MLLNLARVNVLRLDVDARGGVVGPLVHVGKEEGRADGWPIVQARAAVPMAARSDLEVEGAVDSVLLCAEDRCQMLRHDCLSATVSGSL